MRVEIFPERTGAEKIDGSPPDGNANIWVIRENFTCKAAKARKRCWQAEAIVPESKLA